jgi:acyl-CoA thioesterase I
MELDKYVNICVFGDSITFGRIDPENGGWVNRLKVYIEKQKLFNKVFNLGIPGNTTEILLKRIENELIMRKKDIIIIQIGFNDSAEVKGKKNVQLNSYKKNLQEIIKICQKFTDKIIFIGMFKCDENKTTPLRTFYFYNKELQKYSFVIKEICKKENITFISLENVLNVKEDLADGLHPNAQGHEKIFKRVLPVIEKIK